MQSFSDYVSGRREQRRSFIRKFETGFTSWLEMKHLTGMRVAAIASVTCTAHCSETKKGCENVYVVCSGNGRFKGSGYAVRA